jgi:hypothetical protein
VSSVQEQAVELVEQFGWSVFRLNITHDLVHCNGGTASCKSINHSLRKVVSNDPAVIELWDWSGWNAYGIDCGESGLVVVDQDPGAVWPFNGTRVHSTGRGFHFLYEDMLGLGNRAALEPWGVDVRGVGGYVIGPGSWHPHGVYGIEKDGPVGQPPTELIEAAQRNVGSGSEDVGDLDPLDAYERLLRCYERMAAAEVGERNNRLNTEAFTAAGIWARVATEDRTGELDEDRIKQRLYDSIPDDGNPAKSWGSIRSGWEAGVLKPIPDQEAPPLEKRGLFQASETLDHIYRAAMSRFVNPEGVLVSVLGRVLAEVPPSVRLPAVIGSEASLNLGVALVSDSGGGKSSTLDASAELLGIVGLEQRLNIERPFGSGEGLAQSFLIRGEDKSQVVIEDPRRIFICDEIEAVLNQAGRQGATIMAIWRSSLTGDLLGQTNADPSKSRCVPSGQYRMVSLIGVQVSRSGKLLSPDETATGTPQRMVWADADASNVMWPEQDVEWPGEIDWTVPSLPDFIDYPEHVKEYVRELRKSKDRKREHSHSTLVRLKVAAALAILHEETTISDRWWNWAGVIVERSHTIETMCRQSTQNIRQGAANTEAVVKRRAEHAADEDVMGKGVESIMNRLRKRPNEDLSWMDVRPQLYVRRGTETEDWVDALKDQHPEVIISKEDREGRGGTKWLFRLEAK